jgi:DNA-binding CsgD family transcriptional regulator
VRASLIEKPLTAREIEVIQLIADGHGNREVAERLHLSPLTIKSHLARIAFKLGNGSRAAQVAIAWRRGLLR